MKPLLLVDLDRTLFKTDEFTRKFVEIISRISYKDPKIVRSAFEEYKKDDYYKRHVNFIEIINNFDLSLYDLKRKLSKLIKPNFFLYNDVPSFINWAKKQVIYELKILTVGQKEYQILKIALCPILDGIPMEMIDSRKNEFIKRQYATRSGILIDDKHGQKLPLGWTEVFIDRNNKTLTTPGKMDNRSWRISSLKDVRSLI